MAGTNRRAGDDWEQAVVAFLTACNDNDRQTAGWAEPTGRANAMISSASPPSSRRIGFCIIGAAQATECLRISRRTAPIGPVQNDVPRKGCSVIISIRSFHTPVFPYEHGVAVLWTIKLSYFPAQNSAWLAC